MAKFEDTVRKYHERLKKDFQINDVQACGIWGNLGHETGGFKHLQELNPTVKGSKGGYGWMQWTGPRRKKYEAWCKKQGKNPADDETNYLYLVQETLSDEWKSIQQVRKTTTLKAATETFMLLNLRPGVRHLESRVKWAEKAQDALKVKTGMVVAGAVVATGGAATAAAYVPTNYLPYIVAGLLVAGFVGWVIYEWKNNV